MPETPSSPVPVATDPAVDPTADPTRSGRLTRRAAVVGAAWAVPAVTLLAAAPAAAASTDPPVVLVTPITATLPAVRRCSTIAAGTVRFTVTVDGRFADDGEVVHVELPNGLELVGQPDPHRIDLAVVGGVVSLPAIRALGALGSYSVVASYGTGSGAVTVPLTEIAAGTLFTWSQVNSSAATVSQNAAWPQAHTVAVADNAFTALGPGGAVSYWGDAFFASKTAVGTIGSLSGLNRLAVWSTYTNVWYAGILVSDGTSVWYITSANRVVGSPQRVTGVTGQVLDLRTHDGAVYVRTTDGIFYGGAAANNSSPTALSLVPGSPGAGMFDTWATKTDKFYTGGAFVNAAGTVTQFTADASTPLATAAAPGAPVGIVSLFAGNNSIAALSDRGNVHTYGSAFASKYWTMRVSGVAAISGWSADFTVVVVNVQAAGLAMLDRSGQVTVGYAASNSSWMTKKVGGLSAVTLVGVTASDGFYQALDANGAVWTWTGNADGTVTTATRLPGQPPATADMRAFGVHSGSFYGYGIGIAAAACAV